MNWSRFWPYTVQGGFKEARTNVAFVDGTGTGKTHLSVAIGFHCIRSGARVLDQLNKLEQEKAMARPGAWPWPSHASI